ncbi:hypothetical protein NUH30_18620 [Leptospira sp. 85282-16]|nr:hypothetical protein [Leptospira sp. 85282-16]
MNFWEHFDIDNDHSHNKTFLFEKTKSKIRHSCEFCSDHWGTVVRLFKSQSDFENSDFYGGEDVVKGDPRAKIAVWPGKNNIGRDKNSYWLCAPVHPNCYSSDTEVLTNNGFKLFKDVLDSDLIFSINPKTQKMEYVPFIERIQYPYKGGMIHFKARGFDALVTPEHNMYFRERYRPKKQKQEIRYGILPANHLITKSEFTIPRTGLWEGEKSTRRERLLAMFYGWYASEGSKVRKSQISITQHKERNYRRLWKILDKLNIVYSKGNGRFYISGKFAEEVLRDCPGKQYERRVPEWIKTKDKSLIKCFLREYILGDGSFRTRKCFGYDSTEITITTSSSTMQADLVELIHKAGYSAYTWIASEKGTISKHRNGEYSSNQDQLAISVSKSKGVLFSNQNSSKVEYVDYDDMVYCLTLQKNHVLLFRRNGNIGWSGNCGCEIEVEETVHESVEDLEDWYSTLEWD